MLKRNITYTDFNDNVVTEPFYFNLTKTEFVEIDSKYPGGIAAAFRRIGEAAEIREEGVSEFRKFILAAYGIKSDDGKKFTKSDALREEFISMAAFDALFIELSTDDKKMAEFIIGVMPKEFSQSLSESLDTAPKPAIQIPPLAPPTPTGTEG